MKNVSFHEIRDFPQISTNLVSFVKIFKLYTHITLKYKNSVNLGIFSKPIVKLCVFPGELGWTLHTVLYCVPDDVPAPIPRYIITFETESILIIHNTTILTAVTGR